MKSKAEHKTMQYKAFDKFYKEYFQKGNCLKVGLHSSAGIMLFIFVVLMMVPYQALERNQFAFILPIVLGYSAAGAYLSPYRVYVNSQNAIVSLWEVLQNQPLSKGFWWKYLFKKLLVFQIKFYVIAQAGQLLFSIRSPYSVSLGSFLYPLFGALVWPVLANGITLYRDSEVIKLNIS